MKGKPYVEVKRKQRARGNSGRLGRGRMRREEEREQWTGKERPAN